MNRFADGVMTDELLFGRSEPMQQLRSQIDGIADCGLPVLIEGESGTGKEVLARAIHARSSRHTQSFVKINCSTALSLPGLEKLIFGGASEPDRGDAGSLHSTDLPAGTVLFDDITALDVSSQTSVFALLQDPRLAGTGVGGQIVCTTKTSLRPKLESGAFRDDLYYRINVVNLRLPPLRQRRVDIPALAYHFLAVYADVYDRQPEPFSSHLLELFMGANWPGNIRELENTVKRYIIVGRAEPIMADLQKQTLAPLMPDMLGSMSLKDLKRSAVRDCEYKVILTSLTRNHWNRRRTARELDISYRSLLYTMEQLGLPKKRDLPKAEGGGGTRSGS